MRFAVRGMTPAGGAERTWGQRVFIVGALLVKLLLLYLVFG